MSGLVDVHSHFVTPEYVEAGIAAGIANPDGMPGWPTWTADGHLSLMDRWGVTTSMLSISSPGTHFGDDDTARKLTRHVNDVGAELRLRRPDRFGHFASLPLPDVDGALEELARALDELGSDGVAIETNTHGVYLGDARYAPLWTELNRRKAVVFVHPTSPPHAEEISLGRPRPMLEFLFDSARAASDLVFTGVLVSHPDIQWIFTHGAGVLPLVAERMQMMSAVLGSGTTAPSVPEQLSRLWFDMAGTPFPHQVPALDRAFGTERLLYGTDYCWTPPPGVDRQLASIDQAPQPGGTTWRELTTRNSARLFPRLTGSA
ncbi:amidohydrolase family protein [Umezawaea endophytica]|uniref:Amidohydrolase n=1 Tax=Umezawaea endophytica TaxID=1654476 RepID=A0A9X3A285_9PSEU|nr:amidohydrolase family protein [Umezawaea endophytica]MCS7480449.1 amidohydrolase [Umezawaea endophytica]